MAESRPGRVAPLRLPGEHECAGGGRLVTAILGLFLSTYAIAAQADVIGPWVGVNTYHFSREDPVNEDNRIIGLRYNRWFGTRFNNSFNNPSWAIGYAAWQYRRPLFGEHLDNLHYTLRLSPGVAYGYGNRFALSVGGFTPGIIPSVGVEWTISRRWVLGTDVLYVWTERGGVLLQGIHLAWRW